MSNRYWLSALAATCIVAAAMVIHGQQTLERRAAALELENAKLAVDEVSKGIKASALQLSDSVRDLADADGVLRLVQDGTDAAGETADLAEAARSADVLLVLNAARAMRWSSGTFDSPATLPALLQMAADTQAPHVNFSNGMWVAVRPIKARGGAAALGWVVGARAVLPALQTQLQAVAPGAALEILSPGELAAAASKPGPALSVTGKSNGAVVRDADGHAVWAVKFTRPADQAARAIGGDYLGAYLPLFACIIAIGVLTAFAARRYLRRQKSVDARYKALIDQANDGIVIVDSKSLQVLYSNPAILSLLDYSEEEAKCLRLTDIFADVTAAPESLLNRLRDTNSRMAMNLQQRCKNGALIDAEVRCNALDVDGRDVLAYVTHDVSVRRKAEQQLHENQQRLDRMAHHDQLTGLPNRHYLSTFLPQAIEESKAAGVMLGVVFLDLDRFKHINDTRGHETGDKLLQEVARRLRTCVRESDVVIRMGGDEFVVVFRSVKSYDEVTLGASRIVEALSSPIVIDAHPLETTGSVGVSMYPRDGANMVELLKHSDTAMYQAKDRGRNNVQIFSHVMNRKLKQRVAMEASLREALRLKQLDVHYQPFVNLQSRKVVGLEALIRWHHPVHGMIPPDRFIPVAEETGLIVPMGNFVLHRTLQTMNSWRKAGVSLVPVSINVAPAQLQRGDLHVTLATLLKTHALRAELIQLEMTERAVFDSKAPAADNRQDTMAKLRDLGVKIAIDDFGTGYSSLSYLKNWRVDALKIDRSFVRDLATDSSDVAIISAIIAIARHLNIQVIAEGIEGYQQVEILRRLGCSIGQGFLFARPMPADQVIESLRERVGPVKEEEDMLAAFSAGRG